MRCAGFGVMTRVTLIDLHFQGMVCLDLYFGVAYLDQSGKRLLSGQEEDKSIKSFNLAPGVWISAEFTGATWPYGGLSLYYQ